mgnify:CR=1 FL=1
MPSRRRVRDKRPLNVKIPAGVRSGVRIRLSGQGEAGVAGGPSGDLYVETKVTQDPTFTRDGDDLHVTVQIPMTSAAATMRFVMVMSACEGVGSPDGWLWSSPLN